jgi:ACR3 family arsenite efflux pump ArsB
MAYIQLIINMIAFGAILWAMNVYIPMNATVRKVANAVVIVIAIPFVLGAFGFFRPISW